MSRRPAGGASLAQVALIDAALSAAAAALDAEEAARGGGGSGGGARAAGRAEGDGDDGAPLTQHKLVMALNTAVFAIGMHEQAILNRGPNAASWQGSVASLVKQLERACQVTDPQSPAARVALPAPSRDVDIALDSLTQFIEAGCEPRAAAALRPVADAALRVVGALSSPARVAPLVRHEGLMAALAAALGVRGDAFFARTAVHNAMPVLAHASADPVPASSPLWRDAATRARLRALAAAYAGAVGAPEARGGLSEFETNMMYALALPVAACPEPDRRSLRAAMLEQPGLAQELSACIARAARVLPEPGAAGALPALPPGVGGLVIVATLCADTLPTFERDAQQTLGLQARLLQHPSADGWMEKLLAAAPSLLESIADVVVSGAPWYAAVAAALGAGGGAAGAAAGRTGRAQLLSNFADLARGPFTCAVSALQLVPARLLTARGGVMARLAPALLGLAEAAQAFAWAPPGAGPAGLVEKMRVDAILLGAEAVRLVVDAADALGAGAAAALVEREPGALAALARLSLLEPPAAATARQRPSQFPAIVLVAHCKLRLSASLTLACLSNGRAASRIAALLAASPALAAALGAAVGPTPAERFSSLGGRDPAAVLAVQRRGVAAGIMTRVAEHEARAAPGGWGASWLRRVAM